MSDSIALPIPIKGVNFKDPLPNMDPSYSPWMLNWEPEPQSLRLRNAYVVHVDFDDDTPIALLPFQGTDLFAYVSDTGANVTKIYKITTTSQTVVHTMSTNYVFAYQVDFAGRIGMVSEFTNTLTYDGATWAAWTTAASGTSGVTYKGRFYIGEGSTIKYSTLAAVTGALTTLDLATVFSTSKQIAFMAVLSSSTNNTNEQYLLIASDAGEILLYGGDNPAAANWELVAQVFGPRPLSNYNTNGSASPLYGGRIHLQFNSDVLYISRTGIVSVRKLLEAGGDSAVNVTISESIRPYFTKLMKSSYNKISDDYPTMCYWPEENKIFVLANGFLDSEEAYTDSTLASTMFVYNTVTQAWAIHKIVHPADASTDGARSLVYFNDNIYFVWGFKVMTIDKTSFADEVHGVSQTFAGFTYELDSASLNMQSGKRFKKVESFRPIFKTDFEGDSVGMQAAADFGRKVSNTSYQTLQDGYNNHPYSVGVEGDYIQYRFRGTSDATSTDGFELYAIGVKAK